MGMFIGTPSSIVTNGLTHKTIMHINIDLDYKKWE